MDDPAVYRMSPSPYLSRQYSKCLKPVHDTIYSLLVMSYTSRIFASGLAIHLYTKIFDRRRISVMEVYIELHWQVTGIVRTCCRIWSHLNVANQSLNHVTWKNARSGVNVGRVQRFAN